MHAQEIMKTQYDGKHCYVKFVVGDWVWLHLHQRLAAAITNKLAGMFTPRFYRPFKVEECVRPLAYCLALSPRVRIHHVFHMVFLKKFVGEPPIDIVQLPPIKHGRVLQLMLPFS